MVFNFFCTATQARSHWGALPPTVVPTKIYFKHIRKKNLVPLNTYFVPSRKLKNGLRAWLSQKCCSVTAMHRLLHHACGLLSIMWRQSPLCWNSALCCCFLQASICLVNYKTSPAAGMISVIFLFKQNFPASPCYQRRITIVTQSLLSST